MCKKCGSIFSCHFYAKATRPFICKFKVELSAFSCEISGDQIMSNETSNNLPFKQKLALTNH